MSNRIAQSSDPLQWTGRRVPEGTPCRITCAGGRIVRIESVDPESCSPAAWIAPPLLDLQINGFAGIDFQRDDLEEPDLLAAVSGLRAAGCGQFLLTLITDEWPRMLERIRRLRRLRDRNPALRGAIRGWHCEGPFLSSAPGFCGTHPPQWMRDPSPESMCELRAAAGEDSVLLTIAPERTGAVAAIREARRLGIRVSLGHTDASAAALRDAVAAGATGFTHLGNGCPQQLDRHDNILWRVLESSGLTVSLIPDTHHVAPPLFRLVHRVLGAERIYYTTDAMAAGGMPPGRYSIGPLEIEVGSDQVVRYPGRTHFAGSALAPMAAIFRAASMLGCPWHEVWPAMSIRPARLMGWEGDLRPGRPATFCLLDGAEGGSAVRWAVWENGRLAAEGVYPPAAVAAPGPMPADTYRCQKPSS